MKSLAVANIVGALALWCGGVPAAAAPIAYEATRGGDFGTVDLSTGVYTNLGNSGVQLTGTGVGTDGQLYSGLYRGSAFYRVDTQNGSSPP